MSDNTFRMRIAPAYFASTVEEFADEKPVHYLGYSKCNFRCAFCVFGRRGIDTYPEYTLETFEKKVWKLLTVSKNFKVVGGEPTLNPYVKDISRIIKLYGGKVYLDTNGSRPEIIKAMIDEGLVDVLGLSLKGLTPEEACSTASITNQKLCWDNVFESLAIGSQAEGVRVILTYVACEGHFTAESLERLGELLKPFPNVVLKINNCYNEDKLEGVRKGLDKSDLYDMIKAFVERHPEYKGRTMLFKDHDSCIDKNQIARF